MLGLVISLMWIPMLLGTPADGDEIPTLKLERSSFSETLERSGTLVPADHASIEIWPKAYGGELRWEEVLPHGTPVRKGDRLGRFDTETIDEQIEAAKRDVESARRALENLRLEVALEQEGEDLSLARARAEHDEAVRALEGWEKHELEFARRSADMSEQSRADNIQDQKDELAQLEAMYREDELTDATEEIVLERSRRSLARSLARFELAKEQRAYQDSFELPMQKAQRRRAVEAKAHALKEAVQRAEIARQGRAVRLESAERNLHETEERLGELQHDREQLVLTAPRDGVLLHGGIEDYLPGQASPRHERGDRGAFRQPLLTVADPDHFEIAFDVPESKAASIRNGQVAEATLVYDGATRQGKVRVESYPNPRSAGGPENLYSARLQLSEALPGLVAGMRAKVRIETETLEDVFVLPRAAIFGSGSETHLWISSGQGFQRVPVELGRGDQKQVVVKGELQPSQVVLLGEPPQ